MVFTRILFHSVTTLGLETAFPPCNTLRGFSKKMCISDMITKLYNMYSIWSGSDKERFASIRKILGVLILGSFNKLR